MLQLPHWNNPCVFLAFLSLVRQLKRVLEVFAPLGVVA